MRSEGWSDPNDAPRALPYVSPLPNGIREAELTVVVPVMGPGMAVAVENQGRWHTYIETLVAGSTTRPDNVRVLPVSLPNAPESGVLRAAVGGLQSVAPGNGLCRDLSQAIAQFAARRIQPLKVFVSHTKRGGDSDVPEELVQRVREVILDTKLHEFFDESDLQPGARWEEALKAEAATSALLAIRTDLYATRTWCQKEMLIAKRAGVPAVILDALTHGEERGSFLMDNLPRIPRHSGDDDDVILRTLGQLVDECLKRALWERQRELAIRENVDVAAWWAPHAPEPITLVAWLGQAVTGLPPDDPIVVLHPDPPLGPDELHALEELADLCGVGDRLEVMTPRGLAIRGL